MISCFIVLGLWHGSTSWWECMVEQKCWYEPESKESDVGARGTYSSLRVCPQWPEVLPQVPASQRFHLLPIVPPWGLSLQHKRLWRTFKIQTIARTILDISLAYSPTNLSSKSCQALLFPLCSKLPLSSRLYSDPLTCFLVTLLYILLQSFQTQ